MSKPQAALEQGAALLGGVVFVLGVLGTINFIWGICVLTSLHLPLNHHAFIISTLYYTAFTSLIFWLLIFVSVTTYHDLTNQEQQDQQQETLHIQKKYDSKISLEHYSSTATLESQL